jgi:hypothetical protein
MKVMALPPPSSSLGRTETGMPAVSGLSGRASRSCRKRRSAPPHSASTTSLSVQSAAVGQRAQARHRKLLGGEAALLAHAAVEHRTAAHRRAPSCPRRDRRCGAASCRRRQPVAAPSAPARSVPAPPRRQALATVGAGDTARVRARALGLARTGPEGRQREALRRVAGHRALQQLHAADAVDQRVVHLDEEREAAAVQPFDDGAFPGRALRSSGVLCSRPTSSPSSRSPPGQGSAAWRTWYSRSMSSSSIQAGTGFLVERPASGAGSRAR